MNMYASVTVVSSNDYDLLHVLGSIVLPVRHCKLIELELCSYFEVVHCLIQTFITSKDTESLF